MLREIAREVSRLLERGDGFALATVVASQGSVPGKVGFQMLVRRDGSQVGTVGGAGLERRVHEACGKAMAGGEQRLLEFDLSYKKEGGLDSVCGGSVTVFVHGVAAKPHVLLVGGGHVSHEVAKLCDGLDFLHSVLDSRPEYASRTRFPGAVECHAVAASSLEGRVDPTRYSHVLVAGHSYHEDIAVLTWLLPRFGGHVGLIGSAMKRKEFRERLRTAGVGEPQLERIECPVGLDIGAKTPAEIALSIVAGYLSHRRHMSGS